MRVEALDANDEPPMFVPSSLFAAVAEEAVFSTSVARLEVCLQGQPSTFEAVRQRVCGQFIPQLQSTVVQSCVIVATCILPCSLLV